MNIESFIGNAAVFFGILGSWGLYRQARLIWSNKSAQSVSGTWTITFLAMFTAFLLYGIHQDSFPMKFQGALRVLFSLPVTIGYLVYGRREDRDWFLILLCTVLLALMSVKAVAPVLFTAFSFLGIISSFIQALTIRRNRTRGKVAVELQIIYLSAIVCWLVYSVVRGDVPLMVVSIGFTMSYLSTVVMWFKYK